MDIFVPAPLSNLEAIVKELAPVIDPSARKKIADDIAAFHALNAAEAKKAADARALIKQHQDVLAETKRITEQNKADAEQIRKDRENFVAEAKAEGEKLKAERDNLTTASKDAMRLHDEAVSKLEEAKTKENEIKEQRRLHAIDVQRLSDKENALNKEYEKVEAIKKQHTELLESIKSKDEAIRQIVSR